MPRASIVRALPWSLLLAAAANAENVTELWAVRYNGPNDYSYEQAAAMAVDRDGNVYITGESSTDCDDHDFVTVKYDKQGNQLWVARFEGPALTEYPCNNSPSGIVVDRMGNSYVTGWCRGDDGDYDYLTLKYDPEGNEVWAVRYDGGQNLNDYARAIALDSHENVIVTGGINEPGNTGRHGFATVKYTSDGERRWVADYGRNTKAEALAIAIDAEGSSYVTGRYDDGQQGIADMVTIKYDGNGTPQWNARYATCVPVTIALDAHGNALLGGNDPSRGIIVKYGSTGQQQWVAPFNDAELTALRIGDDDSIVATGASGGPMRTVKYWSDGSLAWLATFNGGVKNPRAFSIALDTAGSIYVAGTIINGEHGQDFLAMKYSRDGEEQWLATYDSPVDGYPYEDTAIAIDVFGSNTVYVAGTSYSTCDGQKGNCPDMAVVRYFQFTGDCIGNERLRADCMQRCRTGSFEIAGTIKSQLPVGTPVTFTLDGADPRKETIRPNGKARTKWKRVTEGSHVVRVEECGIEKATDCCP